MSTFLHLKERLDKLEERLDATREYVAELQRDREALLRRLDSLEAAVRPPTPLATEQAAQAANQDALAAVAGLGPLLAELRDKLAVLGPQPECHACERCHGCPATCGCPGCATTLICPSCTRRRVCPRCQKPLDALGRGVGVFATTGTTFTQEGPSKPLVAACIGCHVNAGGPGEDWQLVARARAVEAVPLPEDNAFAGPGLYPDGGPDTPPRDVDE